MNPYQIGRAYEYRILNKLLKTGLEAKRLFLSRSSDSNIDIITKNGLRIQCRFNLKGTRTIRQALQGVDVLIFRERQRGDDLVCLRLKDFLNLLRRRDEASRGENSGQDPRIENPD